MRGRVWLVRDQAQRYLASTFEEGSSSGGYNVGGYEVKAGTEDGFAPKWVTFPYLAMGRMV